MNLKLIATACLAAFYATTMQAKDYKYESVSGDMMQTQAYPATEDWVKADK